MLIALVWFGGEFGKDILALLPLFRQNKKNRTGFKNTVIRYAVCIRFLLEEKKTKYIICLLGIIRHTWF